jgi:hypothetical protein
MAKKLDLSKATEKQLQKYEAPSPRTLKELQAILRALEKRKHDYGTCVYAVSIASVATFNFMAHKLGITGFQAGCADLDILKRTRGMDRFRIVNYRDLLYPQYEHQFDELKYDALLETNKEWLASEARKLLKDSKRFAADSVREHWQRLAASA